MKKEERGKKVKWWLINFFFPNIVDFESFSKVLNRPGGFRDPGEPEEYCRGFQVFDKDMTGFIGVGQLRYSQCLIPEVQLKSPPSQDFRLSCVGYSTYDLRSVSIHID